MKLFYSIWIGFCLFTTNVSAQSLLNRTVSIDIKSQPLKDVLTILSNEGDFNFSYNSKAINKDSIISLNLKNVTVLQALRKIFNASYEFKETGSYVIIRRKAVATSNLIATKSAKSEYFYITGKVVDDETGERLADATIYEKVNLISTLTDHDGTFVLKLKNKYHTAFISISKDGFEDTTVEVKSNFDQRMSIALTKVEPPYIAYGPQLHDDYYKSGSSPVVSSNVAIASEFSVERKWISSLLLSSKQRVRSMNLKRFYTTRAYQFSVVPGLSTHGKLNPQVTNGISINMFGGYSGGTSMFEIGTLFNIDKRNVQFGQVAGLFNLVGGSVRGFQISCLYNEVADSMNGVQINGLVNIAKHVKGLQIASLFNKAKRLTGLQIGFINVTEGREGTSIGFINLSKGRRAKYRVGFILRLPGKSEM